MSGRAIIHLETLPDGVLLSEDDVIVDLNPAAADEIGVSRDALVGEKVLSLLEDPDLFDGALASAGGTLVAWLRRDLGDRLLQLRANPTGDRRVAWSVRDITEAGKTRAAVAVAAEVTYLLDEEGRVTWRLTDAVDDTVAPLLAGSNPLERVHPEDLPLVLELYARAVADPGLRVTMRVRVRRPDDPERWRLVELAAVNALDHRLLRGILVQVRLLGGDEAVIGSDRVISLAESAPVGMLLTDRHGRTVFRNDLARRLLGPEADAAMGTTWVRLARPEHATELEEAFRRALVSEERTTVTAAFDRPDGTTTWLRVHAVSQRSGAGPTGLVLTLDDVTDGVEARLLADRLTEQLRHLASHDPLTGLPNRTLLFDRLRQALARHHRKGHGIAVMFCDLDGFKRVNDTQGHGAGDAALQEVALRFAHVVREGDTVARVGGDEFVVLCEDVAGDAEATEIAGRLVAALVEPLDVDRERESLGVSVGIALVPSTEGIVDLSAERIVSSADRAMYRAKARGKGGYEVVVLDE